MKQYYTSKQNNLVGQYVKKFTTEDGKIRHILIVDNKQMDIADSTFKRWWTLQAAPVAIVTKETDKKTTEEVVVKQEEAPQSQEAKTAVKTTIQKAQTTNKDASKDKKPAKSAATKQRATEDTTKAKNTNSQKYYKQYKRNEAALYDATIKDNKLCLRDPNKQVITVVYKTDNCFVVCMAVGSGGKRYFKDIEHVIKHVLHDQDIRTTKALTAAILKWSK